MKKIALVLLSVLLVACGQGPATDAAPLPAQRGAGSPSAPVALDYQMPAEAPAGTLLTLDLKVFTPVESGELTIEVAAQQDVSVLDASVRRFPLSAPAQTLQLPLQLLPGSGAERYLVLLITVDTPLGPMSRSFRISLPATAVAPAPAEGVEPEAGMKILPANEPQ